jgi:protein-S-isoprenylcysteine O-methyltransferase Ste14
VTGFLIALVAVLASMLLLGLLSGRWSAESRRTRKAERAVTKIHPVMRIPVPWVYVLTYLLGLALQLLRPIPIHSPLVSSGLRIVGFSLVAAGMVVAFSALGIFRRTKTTTVPFEKPSTLVTSGPYRFSRNPMYLGLATLYAGVACTRLELWPLVVLPLLLAYVNFEVIPVEERRLGEAFGDAYQQYGVRVRRWI